VAQKILEGIFLEEGRSLIVCGDWYVLGIAAPMSAGTGGLVLLPGQGRSNSWDAQNIVVTQTGLIGGGAYDTLGGNRMVLRDAFEVEVQLGETLLWLWAFVLDV